MNAITVNCNIVILSPAVLLTCSVYFDIKRNIGNIREIKVRQKGAPFLDEIDVCQIDSVNNLFGSGVLIIHTA